MSAYEKYPMNQYPADQPAEHQNAENTDCGATARAGQTTQYDDVAVGAILVSQSITTTKRCCIVVFAMEQHESTVAAHTRIKRGGVDKTLEVTVSAIKFGASGGYCHLLYATEVLNAGTYQYDLVADSSQWYFGSCIKIVAVSVS